MITGTTTERLKADFDGEVILPDDENYDTARTVFNAMIDRRPDLILRCNTAQDVAKAVILAREHGALVSVRCSGHNVAGYAVCDGGIVIDLSPMKRIEVDAVGLTIRAEAGLTWGEINDALQPHGLAATGGFVSITGVSGLTLGGGLGWLVRKYGLALDNLLSAQVILADGRLVTASSSENADLFWAIRGGGGNFGVVTSFEFRVYAVGTVLAGIVLHPADKSREVLRRWREFERSSPDDLTQGALLFHVPDDAAGPPGLRGRPVIGVGGVYAGPVDIGEKMLAPMRAYGPPEADMFQPMPYNEAQRMADFLWPAGLHNYWKSSYMHSLCDAAIDIVASFFDRVPSPRTVVVLEYYGDGAVREVSDAATAFGHRNYPYNFLVTSAWSDPADTDRNIKWTRDFFEAMRPFTLDAAYVNYIGDEGTNGLSLSYGVETFARLQEIKAKYDPTNLFRMNQNILPRSHTS